MQGLKTVIKHVDVLGTPLACTTYDAAVETLKHLAQKQATGKVCACNTHIVSMARHDREFGRIMGTFDLLLPDGMPLIWVMNLCGAGLRDRVYGPYFMRHALERLGPPWKHFFFGGTEECLRDLTRNARLLRPDLDVAGTYSPPFRTWTEEDQEMFARMIDEKKPDFIWVALGGERQERWISQNMHRYRRGIFLAVGDAFELLAGRRPFAPIWMQRAGLTWLYRFIQDPKRLWLRYLKYNTFFLFYLIRDGLSKCAKQGIPGVARSAAQSGPLRIAFIGSRGVPARYSGFETVVEELGSRLVERGCAVTVYNRDPYYKTRARTWKGMKIVWMPTIASKNLDTIVHSFLSLLHALFCRYDWIYLCGVGNAPLCRLMKAFCGTRLIINVDGADYRRAKWGGFARRWLKKSECKAVEFADVLIADNREIVKRYQKAYQSEPCYISYGAVADRARVNCGELARWGLAPGRYILYVSRLTPENEAHLLIEAHARLKFPLPLVITGSVGYEKAYYRKLRKLAGDGVVFTGARFGEPYAELSQNALFFVMPAVIEATRLVLLDQMGFGTAILYREIQATREVLGNTGVPFGEGITSRLGLVDALTHKMQELSGKPEYCREVGERSRELASRCYNWDRVTDEYEAILKK